MTRFHWVVLGLSVALASTAAGAQSHGGPRYFFADGTRNAFLLREVVKSADRKIGFNRRYALSSVSCGLGCESDWFVDRKSGMVIEAPDEGESGAEMVWNLAARPDSDVIRITYGPSDGIDNKHCWARSYRLVGRGFKPVSARAPAACPK